MHRRRDPAAKHRVGLGRSVVARLFFFFFFLGRLKLRAGVRQRCHRNNMYCDEVKNSEKYGTRESKIAGENIAGGTGGRGKNGKTHNKSEEITARRYMGCVCLYLRQTDRFSATITYRRRSINTPRAPYCPDRRGEHCPSHVSCVMSACRSAPRTD